MTPKTYTYTAETYGEHGGYGRLDPGEWQGA